MSKYYEINDLDEAKEYLNHEILGNRLNEITKILIDLKINDPINIFFHDAEKVKSSMTLFYFASDKKTNIFKKVLDKYYKGKLDEKQLRY